MGGLKRPCARGREFNWDVSSAERRRSFHHRDHGEEKKEKKNEGSKRKTHHGHVGIRSGNTAVGRHGFEPSKEGFARAKRGFNRGCRPMVAQVSAPAQREMDDHHRN